MIRVEFGTSELTHVLLQTNKFRASAKSVSVNSFRDVSPWRLKLPTVGPKVPSLPTLALKSSSKILTGVHKRHHWSHRPSFPPVGDIVSKPHTYKQTNKHISPVNYPQRIRQIIQ